MRVIPILLFILFFHLTPKVQASTIIDSLKLALQNADHDTVVIRILDQISDAYAEDYKLLDSALIYAQQTYDKSLQLNYLRGKAWGAYNLAYSYDLNGNVKDALEYYEKAKLHYTEIGDEKWIAICMRGKGIAAYFQGDYGRSLEFYHEALAFAKEKKLLTQEANTLINLGVIYRIIENYEQAIDINLRNIELLKTLKDTTTLAKVYNNLGVIYTYQNQFEKALIYLDSCVEIYKLLKDSFNLGAVYITLGDTYLESGENLSKAHAYLYKGYQIMKRFDDNVFQSKALLYLGRTEIQEGRFTIARKYLEEGLHVLEGVEYDEIRRDISAELAKVCYSLNAKDDAYRYLEQSAILNDSINSKARIQYTEEMEVKYETEKKEREIVELNAQRTISELKLSAARRTTLMLVIALLLFSVLLIGLFRLYNEIKAQRNIISASLNEKEALLNNLEKAQKKIIQSEKMASLGQLTAGIAHEINNPNNFISTSAESLQMDMTELKPMLNFINDLKDEKDNESIRKIIAIRNKIDLPFIQKEIDQLLEGITEGAERTTEIVRGLKYFSHPGTTEKEEIDIHQSLDTVLRIMQGEFNGVAILTKVYGKIPKIRVMRNQLNQVFINLISNALDAIREKFDAQSGSLGQITITTGHKATEVFIAFKDNGTGIQPEEQQKVFDPFYTTKAVGTGVGLGLSISYGIIEEHQGRIEIVSEKEKGTEVIIWLPAVKT